jgi:hypothetical protein
MSGGHFDYIQNDIPAIVEELCHLADNDWDNPDTKSWIIETAYHLSKGCILLDRVDNLVCQDDSEDTFIESLRKEFDEFDVRRADW